MIKKCLLFLFTCLLRQLFALRYRLVLKGWDTLKKYPFDPKKGILFLPNHPAELDPVFLATLLYPLFSIRPVVVEHFYYLKGFRVFMDLIGALVLPQMDAKANRFRAERVQKQFVKMVDVLKGGGRLLIYPSGKLRGGTEEKIGGASLVHNFLEAYPDVQIVLIRTTGLWGSLFSKALNGRSPSFGGALWQGVKILFKNALFFAPRREVCITFEVAGDDFKQKLSRLELNRLLESWYNKEKDPLTLVPYFFWSRKLPEVTAQKERQEKLHLEVPKSIVESVNVFLSQLCRQPTSRFKAETHLAEQLGLDSLDLVQVYLFLDEKYDVANLEPGSLVTVSDVWQAAAGYGEYEQIETKTSLPFVWPEEKRSIVFLAEGNTLQEVFLNQVAKLKNQAACVDSVTGLMTYRQLKMRALILANYFKQYPEKHVGVMLPSSCTVYVVILALLLADKVPVMLNWTVGHKALDYAVDLFPLNRVVTSYRFLDRLQLEVLGKVEEKFCFLEEIREEISWRDKIQALWAKPSIKASPTDPAVFLFTSGTESNPKAVPLSHTQLLCNQRAALKAVPLASQDILYGILPPFHSFGFSVTGLFPLLAGLRVCYAPDPTDSHGMARDIARYQPTLMFAAPSFIRALFKVASPQDLHTLRLVVSGAEKTPQELFDYVKAHLPSARLIEGYGITECSPIVSIGRLDEQHIGVGRPLKDLEVIIVDPESKRKLDVGQEGEIAIAGQSVFDGYFGGDKNPFLDVEGKRFYLSGDRGYLDKTGHLILTGRLTRFVKIGGEMVSLGGIEEELLKAFPEVRQDGPPLAVCVKEDGKPELILFVTWDISKESVNEVLKLSGLGRIVKIAEVKKIEAIPLMGTGKINYRLLEKNET
ncbi:MAG: hypothetical protein RLZZ453_608 [Chlamydiota bacterium]|jgi:long-chain-fatty-acid--[acyl-carrier-protein] ligase